MSRCSIALVLPALFASPPLHAQTTSLVSISASGVQGNLESMYPSISPDGRYVTFTSHASTLVPIDTNLCNDVFVRDRLLGTVELVSVSTVGGQGDLDSEISSISADGRYVAFASFATNLVPGDTNGNPDVFVHDRQTGQTTRVSVSSTGAQASLQSVFPSISADGRFVAFTSLASDLVPGDTNSHFDVFVHDRLAGLTSRVSVSSAGLQGDQDSTAPVISADGRYVAFQSRSFVLGAPPPITEIFVHDRVTGQLEMVSVDSSGAPSNYSCAGASISGDGRRIAFVSSGYNLVPGDTNNQSDVFVRDRLLSQTTRVDVSSSGAQSNGAIVANVCISADGRFVGFASDSSNLVPGDTNAWHDIFVHDLVAHDTTRVSVDSFGVQGDQQSGYGVTLSADGRYVAFSSYASNLIQNDQNHWPDVFLRDRALPATGTPFCFGDGSGAACPCGNMSPVGANAGCLNSLGVGGSLTGTGLASINTDTLVLFGSGMTNSSVLYFQATQPGVGVAFGDGLRCAVGSIIRLGAELNTSGISQYPVGPDLPVSVRGVDHPGDMRTYQCWYRNAAAFCQPQTFNLTNGLQLAWGP